MKLFFWLLWLICYFKFLNLMRNFVFVVFFLMPLFSWSQACELPKITVRGNEFYAENKIFVFRGLNTSDPEKLAKQDHWNFAYFETMKSWGANVVRFPIHPATWRRLGKENYLKLLDQGVRWACELRMYVILDWHSIGNIQTEMFQADSYETTKKETYEFWRTMAKHFKGNNTVAFFEIFNEPTTYNGQLGTCTWQEWKNFNEEVIGIIRAHENTAIPLVAGFNWAYDLSSIKLEPINAENIAYVSHPYPQKRPEPWAEKWEKDWGYVKDKYPLILTEIGFAGSEEKGAHIPVISDEKYGEEIVAYCDKKNISWVVWVFDPQWAPSLFSNWNYELTRQGVFFKKALMERK
jgi:endoglucanase